MSNRDLREFDTSDFYCGIGLLLFILGYNIGGIIFTSIGIIIWLFYKAYAYNERKKEQKKNDQIKNK